MNYKDKRIQQFRGEFAFKGSSVTDLMDIAYLEQFLSETIDQAQKEVTEEIKMSIAREYDSYEMLSYAEVMKHIEKYTKGETK